jgi:hypothetical protein
MNWKFWKKPKIEIENIELSKGDKLLFLFDDEFVNQEVLNNFTTTLQKNLKNNDKAIVMANVKGLRIVKISKRGNK